MLPMPVEAGGLTMVTITSPAAPGVATTPSPWKSMVSTPDRTSVFSSCTDRFGLVTGMAVIVYGFVGEPVPPTSMPGPRSIAPPQESLAQPQRLGAIAAPGFTPSVAPPSWGGRPAGPASQVLIMKGSDRYGGMMSSGSPVPGPLPVDPLKFGTLMEWVCVPCVSTGFADWCAPVPPARRTLLSLGLDPSSETINLCTCDPPEPVVTAPWSWLRVCEWGGRLGPPMVFVSAPPATPIGRVGEVPIGSRAARFGSAKLATPSPP